MFLKVKNKKKCHSTCRQHSVNTLFIKLKTKMQSLLRVRPNTLSDTLIGGTHGHMDTVSSFISIKGFKPISGCLRSGLSCFNWWVSFAPEVQDCYFCESSCLFYLVFISDFYVSVYFSKCLSNQGRTKGEGWSTAN